MNGILLIDKPKDFTSFDVIAKLRGMLKMRRLGHAGTLDPMATGVLPVFVGYATKACGILPNEDKIYIAEFQLGKVSDTQDSTGNILEIRDFSSVTESNISRFLPHGTIMQIPPMYSAVKVDGKKLYELARQGKEVERKAKEITVYESRLLQFHEITGIGTVQIHCSKGTYVRTLIHDMGQGLGCGAIMTDLRRISASGFSIADCHTLDEIQKLADNGNVESIILPIAKAFEDLPKIHLDEKQTIHYKNGVKLGLSQLKHQLSNANRYSVYGMPDGFLGTAVTDFENDCLRIERNLSER
ncbi:MAG: tRNA pseudouridine(55) synthase TruB [Oscillospiraceae bacterium]